MKSIRDRIEKLKSSRLAIKLKGIKNIEIVIAVFLALVAAILFFGISAKNNTTKSSSATVIEMTEEEKRIAGLISEIAGVGDARVLISKDERNAVIGVVIVSEGANDAATRVKMLRCAEKATGVSVDQIEIFVKENGG